MELGTQANSWQKRLQVVPTPSRFGPGRSGPKLKVDSAPFEIKYFWTERHKYLSFQNVFDRFEFLNFKNSNIRIFCV